MRAKSMKDYFKIAKFNEVCCERVLDLKQK